MDSLIPLLEAGISRHEFTDTKEFYQKGWFGKRDYVPGGAVSYSSMNWDNLLTIPDANQDLITSWNIACETKGAGVYGVPEILHVKTPSSRPHLLDDMLRVSDRHTFGLTCAYMDLMAERTGYQSPHSGVKSLNEDFRVQGNAACLQIPETALSILHSMNSLPPDSVWNTHAGRISAFCKEAVQNADAFQSVFSASGENARERAIEVYDQYKELSVHWPAIVSKATRIKERKSSTLSL